MPMVNVTIQPAIIDWVLSQTSEEKIGAKLMENVKHWLDGTKNPTFRQIEDLSKKTQIPLGYFFLQTPPVENIELLEYRTLNSIEIANPSRNLIDTIIEMEKIQDWMVNYRKETNTDKVSIVGSLRGINDVYIIADRIRDDLGIVSKWYEECHDGSEAFRKIRNHLEQCGVIVMMKGIAGKNPHRALDVNEFRAFAVINEWAPLIFINGADSSGGRLFSLFHEMVHIWLGENDLYNDNKHNIAGMKPLEVVCNAVAAELLVPENEFLDVWEKNLDDDLLKIKDLARFFRCSEIVIARRALDKKKINSAQYNQVVTNVIESYVVSKQKKSSGGDYYKTACSRLDGTFVRALCESVNSGRTSYTEAYRLTNTTSKSFPDVVSGLGGVLW